jgi:excinuclease ABC subunit C
VEGIDDFASMREVLGRRFRRLRDEEAKGNAKDRPDLILIDGGKGQLHMAVQAQKEFGYEDIPILGLAKRIEEIFLPNQSDPILLPKTSAALQLLQQVRDEAHRFAITFQRSKRKAKMTQSWLDEVPGIGEATKMKLIRAFKSPFKIREATSEELAAAAGKAAAKKILDWLRQAEAVMESAPPSEGETPVSEAPADERPAS